MKIYRMRFHVHTVRGMVYKDLLIPNGDCSKWWILLYIILVQRFGATKFHPNSEDQNMK